MRPSDEDGFTDFVRAHTPTLFRTAFLMTGDYQRAEDLLQATLVRVYQRWPRVAEMELPVAYARKVLVSQSVSWWRRRSSHESPLVLRDNTARSDRTEEFVEHERVWQAVLTLPPRQRAVTVLRYYEDLSEAEIARTLGMAPGTVKSHAHAASRRLAGLLAEPVVQPARRDAMSLDERLSRAVHHVAGAVEAPEIDLDAVRSGARARRVRTVTATTLPRWWSILVTAAALLADPGSGDATPDPVTPPGIVGEGAVWYDDAGLHRGAVVEETPVDVLDDGGAGVLALVRTGAVYRDPATEDVWFHPWGGEPRVVGHTLDWPGGDPAGDLAVWLEGSELVVYDTARGQEVSRSEPPDIVADYQAREHDKGGNGFKHVSTEEVVWSGTDAVYRLDLRTGEYSTLWELESNAPYLEDVHETTQVWGDIQDFSLSVRTPGQPESHLPGLEPFGRLSADGSYVLAPWESEEGSHGAAIADVPSGSVWNLPGRPFYAWISWSYGDLAVVLEDRNSGQNDARQDLLACDPARRECDPLPFRGEVLLPTS